MVEVQQFNPEFMENIVKLIGVMTGSVENQPSERPFVAYMNAMAAYIRRVLDATVEGKPLVYNHIALFTELFYAFDMQPLCPDIWSSVANQADQNHGPTFIDVAENAGVFHDLCAIGRVTVGKVLTGGIPKPTVQVIHTQPCDSTIMEYSMVAELYSDVPCFIIDSPNWDTPECFDYYTTQIKELISFLEKHTGKKLDRDRLKEVIEESNRAIEYLIGWTELKKVVPCPVNGRFSNFNFPGNLIGLGHPSMTEVYKILFECAKELADRGEGAHVREDLRGVWWQLHPNWDTELLGWLQDKFGLVKVIELTGYVTSVMIDTSSYESILRGLAERWHTSIPMGRQGKGPADLYINDLLHVCGEFKSDTVICFGHAGCRYMKGLQGLVREACRDYGIPYFYVDIDALDPRFTPKETVRAQIDDFLTNVVLQLR
ncbi:MAG: 2-hydroxyacyl-CoA dehydratase family protein [Thermodesulfobacteriota bacterium]|nr:2-hydroxyacyl-CoA dehydratase family protein [Thermodesulfobacteriota bacterium]